MTTAAELMADKPTAQATILKRCVCLVLTCSALGNNRRVDLSQIDLRKHDEDEDIKTDKDEIRARKQLFDREDLKQALNVLHGAKSYLRTVAIPGHRVFGSGTYLVPLAVLVEAIARLKQLQVDLDIAVDALVDRYPEMVEKRKAKLGDLFHAGDYVAQRDVRGEFRLDWNYVNFTAPEQLESVDRAAYDEAIAKNEAQLAQAFDEIILQLRGAALQVMTELIDRLKPGPDGKPKVLRGTALQDLQEFVALLPKRNLTDDDDLTRAVAKVAAYAEGLDVEMLRKAPAVRDNLAALAAQAAGELERLVATAGGRAISFGRLG